MNILIVDNLWGLFQVFFLKNLIEEIKVFGPPKHFVSDPSISISKIVIEVN